MNTALAEATDQLKFDAREKPNVPVRHMDFKFNSSELDDTFYQNTELASAYFEALSIFLTYGEDLVIDTARHHRQFVKDPELKRLVTVLIGQEAIHSKMHNEFNDVLAEHQFPVTFYRFLADKVFKYGFKRLSNRMQLSLMAGIEHFTAVLSEYMMKNEAIFYTSDDEKQRALDLLPSSLTVSSLVMFITAEDDEHEKAIFRRADHQHSEGS